VKRYTYPEAAKELRISERWLRRNISKLPRSKKGRTVTFSEADLDEIDRIFHRNPPQTAPPQAGRLANLKPLPARGRRNPAA
jgi:hypothetical protein